MTDKKLENFKIADTRRPTLVSPTRKENEPAAAESQSLGFKRIEGLLETETQSSVHATLNEILVQLDELEKRGTNKEKAAAKKAIVAVERVDDLMNYLFQTKESLQATAAQNPKG